MIYNLSVTNNQIYIECIPILKFLKSFEDDLCYEIENGIKIYTITNIVFCNISGILNIYITNNEIIKLVFTVYNAINIYNVPNIPINFETTINLIKTNLKQKYRQINDLNFFNKKFTFTITHNEFNMSILISNRILEV